MDYKEALEYIAQTSWRGSKPGLERITRLCSLMGDPQRELEFIHVAGTNGKGSFCALLSSILVKAGYKTGMFISPYLEVFNERMQINGENIPDDELAEITEYTARFADSMEDLPTEFELNTAIAFEYFKRNKCDIVILEAGMGGELDSTNVIDPPLLSVIMHIALDHTAWLGDTKEKIALTKSKIIKKGSRAVLYKQDESVTQIIRDRCAEVGSKLYISEPESLGLIKADLSGQAFETEDFGEITVPLIGKYQAENIAVVLKAAEALREAGYKIPESSVKDGLKETKWPGRFEILRKDPYFIVDGGHNPDGIRATKESLETFFKGEKIIFIFGVMADKNYEKMTDIILPVAKEVFCVAPDNERALPPVELAELINKKNVPARACKDVKEAVFLALKNSKETMPVCATGSLYMAGEIRKLIIKDQ